MHLSSGTSPAPAEARRSRTDCTEPGRGALERAIVQTVAYADVFDYPLTAEEIQRYLIGVPASRGSVCNALGSGQLVPDLLSHSGRYFTLAGREAAIETRRARAGPAAAYWRRAVRYGHVIGGLPFVRMVAVTGGLAMDNVADDDIDYFIVTEPRRLWLCRALIVTVVRIAALRGTELCPNYFLSEQALQLSERNLFTAHEVAQMVPLTGIQTYERLRALNRWTETYLPNALGPPQRVAAVEPRPRRARRLVERTMRSRIGGRLEHWEMTRKLRKFGQRSNGHAEAAFGPDWCKGHFGDHGKLTLARYDECLRALERRTKRPVTLAVPDQTVSPTDRHRTPSPSETHQRVILGEASQRPAPNPTETHQGPTAEPTDAQQHQAFSVAEAQEHQTVILSDAQQRPTPNQADTLQGLTIEPSDAKQDQAFSAAEAHEHQTVILSDALQHPTPNRADTLQESTDEPTNAQQNQARSAAEAHEHQTVILSDAKDRP